MVFSLPHVSIVHEKLNFQCVSGCNSIFFQEIAASISPNSCGEVGLGSPSYVPKDGPSTEGALTAQVPGVEGEGMGRDRLFPGTHGGGRTDVIEKWIK